MRLVLNCDESVAAWVGNRIDADFRDYAAIGLELGDRLIAGCVYHNHLPDYGNIEMSIASATPIWAKPEVIAAFLRYPFDQLQCRRVTACTPGRNAKTRKFLSHIGFRKEGCIRQGYAKDDLIIYGLLRNEARRWINPN